MQVQKAGVGTDNNTSIRFQDERTGGGKKSFNKKPVPDLFCLVLEIKCEVQDILAFGKLGYKNLETIQIRKQYK